MSHSELIKTKLNRPLLPLNYIRRKRLTEILHQGVEAPLAIISASAGYGKSSLVSCWLEKYDLPNAWLSLDEKDNEIRIFLNYFILAIQGVFPSFGDKNLSLVNLTDIPSASKLVARLINDLTEIEHPLIFVLDDYHHIDAPSIHDLIKEILRYPPPNLHLVLISRNHLPFPLETYRAHWQITEIESSALSFTAEETQEYLQHTLKRELDNTSSLICYERTEGWIAGIQFIALAIRNHSQTDNFPPKILEDTLHARKFFYSEIFLPQTPEVRHYLLSTAILNRFNAPLSEVLSRSEDKDDTITLTGWAFINWLKKRNLFLISLDAEEGWFSYHHLFKDLLLNLLKRRYTKEKINQLYVRASDWFADQGFTEEAIEYSLAAQDLVRAADVIEKIGFKAMDEQRWPRLQRWLAMLPNEAIRQSPVLLILQSWLYHVQLNLINFTINLRNFDALRTTDKPDILRKIKAMQCHHEALSGFEAYMEGHGERALSLMQRACASFNHSHKRARVFSHIFQLGSYQMLGDFETGLALYKKATEHPSVINSSYSYMYQVNLCFTYWIDADLLSLKKTAGNLAILDRDRLFPETAAMGKYFEGLACYMHNDLVCAEETLSQAIDQFYNCHVTLFCDASFILALVYQAKGEFEMAIKTCQNVENFAVDSNNSTILSIAQSFAAELALRQGDLETPSQWAKHFPVKPFLPTYHFYMPQLTLIKTLLAQNTPSSLKQASAILDELYAFQVSINNKVFLIHVLVLQTLLHHKLGADEVAQDKLALAVTLAEPSNFLRLFVDLGPEMFVILKKLVVQNVAVKYIGRILAIFKASGSTAGAKISDDQINISFPSISHFLTEPLTTRETDVLNLLVKRLRNKEIADELFISTETVKSHLTHIYRKLNVKNRKQAIIKISEIGVTSDNLPPFSHSK